MRRRCVAVFAGVALAALALTACSTTNGAGDPGSAAGTAPSGEELAVGAAWLAGGSLIAIVTDGSSSCTPRVDDAVLDEGVLVVTLTERDAEAVCTDDLVSRGTIVGVPAGVEAGSGLDIQVTLDDVFGETSLDAYTGGAVTEYTPSAGWVDDQRFALLTWGSSSCAPRVASAVAETPTSVSVAFEVPAADQVCTMDMAPRVAVVTVEGEVSRDATISLADGGERPTPEIPIH